MSNIRKNDWLSLVLLVVLLFFYAAWTYGPAQEYDWKYDEGLDISKASLLLQGHVLYTDIWADQPPLYTILAAGAMALWGEEVIVARLVVLALSLVGLASLFAISRLIMRDEWALLPVVAIMLMPHFQGLSRLILIGLPAISLGLAALVFAVRYHLDRRRLDLVLAASVFAASLLIKPITAPLFPAMCALVWLAPQGAKDEPGAWRDVALLCLISLALVVTPMFSGGLSFVRQIVGTLFETRDTLASPWAGNALMIAEYLTADKWGLSHVGLACLATVGLAALVLDGSWHWLTVLGLWLGGVIVALLWQTPLRSHELFLLMPPLAVLAALGAQATFRGLRHWRDADVWRRALILAGCAAALYALAWAPAAVQADVDQRTTSMGLRDKTAARQSGVQFLRDTTPPDSTVVTDDPMLTFLAARQLPPELVVSSYRRVQAGELSLDDMIRLDEVYQPAAIMLWRGGFDRIDGYRAWVDANYCLTRAYEDDQRIYLPRPAPQTWTEQQVWSQQGLTFLGCSTEDLVVEPGQTLTATLYWQAEHQIAEDYTLFMHLLDQSGERVAGADLPPLDGQYTTSDWLPGQMIGQRLSLVVPAQATPGPKLLSVGMYDSRKDRLALMDGDGQLLGEGQTILTTRPVVRWEARYDAPTMQHAHGARLGDVVELLGYDAPDSVAASSGKVDLTLYWRCLAPMATDYKVFAHVLDQNGEIVAQQDQQPGAGLFPTTGWVQGEVIVDRLGVALPDGLAAADCQLRLGMYDGRTGVRLGVVDATASGPGDSILIKGFLNVVP